MICHICLSPFCFSVCSSIASMANVKLCFEVTITFKCLNSFKVVYFLFFFFFFPTQKISQVMFYKLKEKEVEQEAETKKFIGEYGEQAFIERQKLL